MQSNFLIELEFSVCFVKCNRLIAISPLSVHDKQAAGGRHNVPLTPASWPLTLKVVSESCDVGYLCANFSLPRPLCSQLRPDVRDRQTSDAHIRLMPPILGEVA